MSQKVNSLAWTLSVVLVGLVILDYIGLKVTQNLNASQISYYVNVEISNKQESFLSLKDVIFANEADIPNKVYCVSDIVYIKFNKQNSKYNKVIYDPYYIIVKDSSGNIVYSPIVSIDSVCAPKKEAIDLWISAEPELTIVDFSK